MVLQGEALQGRNDIMMTMMIMMIQPIMMMIMIEAMVNSAKVLLGPVWNSAKALEAAVSILSADRTQTGQCCWAPQCLSLIHI